MWSRLPHRCLALLPLWLPGLWAQPGAIVTVVPPARMNAVRESAASSKLSVQLRSGYHVSSSTPSEDYMVPLSLTWDASPLAVREILYPKPQSVSYSFSTKPISVYTSDFEIVTRFAVPAKAPLGMSMLAGKLRYQACNNTMCFPPKTVEVRLPVDIQSK